MRGYVSMTAESGGVTFSTPKAIALTHTGANEASIPGLPPRGEGHAVMLIRSHEQYGEQTPLELGDPDLIHVTFYGVSLTELRDMLDIALREHVVNEMAEEAL